MKYLVFALICGLASACGNSGSGNPTNTATNTEVNRRDSTYATKTPLDQNENSKDIAITAEIRKRIVDSSMSVDATNSKIVTQDGKVTLRGPVATAEEKGRIDTIAKEVAGPDNVDNQLDVSGK